MSILGSIVQSSGGDGGSGTPGVIGEEAGSTAPNADANKKRLFLDTEKNNLLTAIDEAGALTVIDEFIDTPQTTAANLETNFPAASNNSVFAWIAGATAENGLYLSNGTSWGKQLDNSGDRAQLFNYAGGLAYSGVNNLSSSSGTSVWNRANDSTAIAIGGAGFEYDKAFDNNTGTSVQCNTSDATNLANSYLYKTLDTPLTLGRFAVTMSASYTAVTSYRLVGRDSLGAFTVLPVTSISGDGTLSGNSVTGITNSDSTVITTSSTVEYESYGVEILQNGSGNTGIAEISGEIVTDNTATIDCVKAVNNLHAGVGKIEPTALTADTLLDDTDGTVLLDPSGADFTMTLPAVATVLTGKKYTFVLTTAPATTGVTLDGASAETINGATTNATALTSQWDTVTIQSDGTQWVICASDLDEADIETGEFVISTALTSTSNSIATNAALSESFTHLTTENTTLANPTNLKAGKTYTFKITQSASTARTLAYGSVFKFSGGTAPILTASVNAVDLICGISDGTNIYCNFLADVQ